jgi:hypothetical protein
LRGFSLAERGQSAVEFALVLPVLLLIVVGVFKFGTAYNNYLQLTNAVRSGARQFGVERGQASPCTDAAAQVDAAAGSLKTAQLVITMAVSPATTSYSTPPETGTCPTLNSGDSAILSATYPCDLTIMGINFDPSCKLTASATERVE